MVQPAISRHRTRSSNGTRTELATARTPPPARRQQPTPARDQAPRHRARRICRHRPFRRRHRQPHRCRAPLLVRRRRLIRARRSASPPRPRARHHLLTMAPTPARRRPRPAPRAQRRPDRHTLGVHMRCWSVMRLRHGSRRTEVARTEGHRPGTCVSRRPSTAVAQDRRIAATRPVARRHRPRIRPAPAR